MYKKILTSLLTLALINFLVGCYSSELINVTEYEQIKEKETSDDILVVTKDSKEYRFSETNFYIENDTLYGKMTLPNTGKLPVRMPFANRVKLYDKNIALADIESIQYEYLNGVTTTILVVGIVGGILGLAAYAINNGLKGMWSGRSK